MQKKKYFIFLAFLIISFFINAANIFAQNYNDSMPAIPENRPMMPHRHDEIMNINGRHMRRHGLFFDIIGLKISDAEDELSVSVYFNDSVDADSVSSDKILIDDDLISPKTDFLFSKTRRMLRFNIARRNNFSIKMNSIKSFDGRLIPPFEEKNLNSGDFVKYPSRNVQPDANPEIVPQGKNPPESFPPGYFLQPPLPRENHIKENHQDEI